MYLSFTAWSYIARSQICAYSYVEETALYVAFALAQTIYVRRMTFNIFLKISFYNCFASSSFLYILAFLITDNEINIYYHIVCINSSTSL